MNRFGAIFAITGVVGLWAYAAAFFVSINNYKTPFASANKAARTISSQNVSNNPLFCTVKFQRLNSKSEVEVGPVKFDWVATQETDLIQAPYYTKGKILSDNKDYEIQILALLYPKGVATKNVEVFADAYLFETKTEKKPLSWMSTRSHQEGSQNLPEGISVIRTSLNNVQIPGRILANSASPLDVTESAAQQKGWVDGDTLVFASLDCRIKN